MTDKTDRTICFNCGDTGYADGRTDSDARRPCPYCAEGVWEAMLAEVQALLCQAADRLEAFEHDAALQADLRAKAQALHQELDPHCTCNDCLEAFAHTIEQEDLDRAGGLGEGR